LDDELDDELDAMTTPGHCILSHGFESGPDATKVTALAEAAQRLGWSCERPDYTDLDARREVGELGDVPARLQRLLDLAQQAAQRGPLVLAGSSLGAYISGLASLQVPVVGLFLMAPPIRMGSAQPLQAASVPTSIIHGWDDELIPAAHVVDWAHVRRARLLLVDDSHRLSAHVQASADAFASLLAAIPSTVSQEVLSKS
jgi:predicted alpha/beta-hydrolase family hydrolase